MNEGNEVKHVIHVIPVGGAEPLHVAACNCWCSPLPKSHDMLIHHAKDCREKWERQGINERDKPWVLVYEAVPQVEPLTLVQCAVAELDVVYALNAALPGIEVADGKLPSEIQFMPPGQHRITPLVNGEPKTINVKVDAKAAARLASEFAAMRVRAQAGEGDLPFFDFNHDDNAAAAHPTELYWAGDDAQRGGIRAKLEWTDEGKKAVLGKTYRRFSPSFGLTKGGEVSLASVNLGGLVNKAAFQRISPIWSRNGSLRTATTATDHQQTNQPMKTVEEQLADLTTAVGKVTESVTAIAGQVAEIKAKGAGAGDGKVIVLETKLAGIEAAMQVQAKGAAQAKVAEAIKAGKIPAQNKDLIAQWENLLVIDAKNAALIDALPVNPALVSIVGAGAGSGSAQTTTEHAFVVKAKEHAKANNITDIVDAQSQFARTVEGAGLYADYIANLGK